MFVFVFAKKLTRISLAIVLVPGLSGNMISTCLFFELFFLQPVLGGHPVLSGNLAIPQGWPLNTGSTVVCAKNKLKYTSTIMIIYWSYLLYSNTVRINDMLPAERLTMKCCQSSIKGISWSISPSVDWARNKFSVKIFVVVKMLVSYLTNVVFSGLLLGVTKQSNAVTSNEKTSNEIKIQEVKKL